MVSIQREEACCGCGACKQICEEKCITMKQDKKGFFYPVVDNEKCTGCGKCVSACFLNDEEFSLEGRIYPPAVYAAITKNAEEHKISSSGGIFTAISNYVFSQNGVVFGAGFDENVYLRTSYALNKESLYELIGSKYVQCDTGNSYAEIRGLLREGRYVFYCGAPCQIKGLYSFLGEDCQNLLTADFICQGVPSPGAFKRYMEYLGAKHDDKVVKFRFRDNTFCSHACQNLVYLEKKGVIKGPTYESPFRKIFIPNISLRPGCYECRFANDKRVGDITLSDFQSISQLDKRLNIDSRYSAIILNTGKGTEVFNKIKENLELIETNIEFVKTFQPRLYVPAKKQEETDSFWEDYDSRSFQYVLSKYTTAKYFGNNDAVEQAINRNILYLAINGYITDVTLEVLLKLWYEMCEWILIPPGPSDELFEEYTEEIHNVKEYGVFYLTGFISKNTAKG